MVPNTPAEPWEAHMQAYPYVIEHENTLYLFYNGNSFGQGGIGVKTLPVEDLPPITHTHNEEAS